MKVWMKRMLFRFVSIFVVLLFPGLSLAKISLDGQAKISYLFLDDYGNKSNMEEMYNVYSGPILSNFYLNGISNNGFSFNTNIYNFNEKCRNLSLGIGKFQLFEVNVSRVESRFIYDDARRILSEREYSKVNGYIRPIKCLKIIIGYSSQIKDGERESFLEDGFDFLGNFYNYKIQRGEIGAELSHGGNHLAVTYGLKSFDSDAHAAFNKRGHEVKARAGVFLSKNTFFNLSYFRDDNTLKESNKKLITDLLNGSISFTPIKKTKASSEVLVQKTENRYTQVYSYIFRLDEKLSYNFSKWSNGTIGYEYQTRKEAEDKIGINSYLAEIRIKPISPLQFKANYQTRRVAERKPTHLTGPFNREDLLLEAKVTPLKMAKLELRFENRERENLDFSAVGRTRGYVSSAWVEFKDKEILQVDYSNLDVKYTDALGQYHTKNNILTSQIILMPLKKLTLKGGWSYIDIQGDVELWKHNVSAGLAYQVGQGFSLEGEYNLFKHDNFFYPTKDYKANLFTLSLIKKFNPKN
jgi:hypothetical protein